jgi:outer membrane protein TolC
MTSGYAQTITLEQYLNQLQRIHPLFEQENLTAQIEREDRNSFLGTQDWTLFSSVTFSHERPAIAFSGPERTDALSIQGGVERLFWDTGGRLSASFSASRAEIKINPLFGFPESFYQNVLSVTYTHPLLKNRNGFLDKLAYELKQFDIDFSEVQALENKEDFLNTVALKFLDWIYLTEQKVIVQERLRLSEEELERTESKRKAYLIDQVDVIRAEDAVRISKQNQVLVESQLAAIRGELAVLLINFMPEYNLYKIEEALSHEDALSQLNKNSRLLKILNVRHHQLEYTQKGFEEALKPDLSLIAQVNTKNIDESLSRSLVMDKPDVLVGLEFRVPLENRAVKSRISKTDLQISQLQKQYDNVRLALTSALTNLVTQIDELKHVLSLNREQIESAKDRTVEEIKLYNQGRGDLTFVIQSRDNEQNAKLRYASNALTYNKLIVNYKALVDQLLIE